MKITFKKLSQKGMLSLHVLLPALLVIASIGGIGAYVLQKSNAVSLLSCSTPYRSVTKNTTISVKVTCTNKTNAAQYASSKAIAQVNGPLANGYIQSYPIHMTQSSTVKIYPQQTKTMYYVGKVGSDIPAGTRPVTVYAVSNNPFSASNKWVILN